MGAHTGILYGIGVGPGDPELLPVKSANILKQVDIVYAASSTKNDYSLAVSIAKQYIPASTEIKMLQFPMTTDKSRTSAAWRENACTVIDALESGKSAAFLTLGDSMTYSTYGYILRNVQELAPHITLKTVPGITSYQAAAASLNTPLVEGEESLLLVSGVHGGKHIRHLNGKPENVVILKAYRNVEDITAEIEKNPSYTSCVGIKKCGLPEEEIIRDLQQLKTMPPDYWTLIIAKKKTEDGTPKG